MKSHLFKAGMTDKGLNGLVVEELYSHLSFRYIGSSSSDTGTAGSGLCILIDTAQRKKKPTSTGS